MMSNAIETAKQYVNGNNYENAISLARKNHGNDNVEDYLAILDLLIDANYLPAIEEKGIYYQHYDESHDNYDYGGSSNSHFRSSILYTKLYICIDWSRYIKFCDNFIHRNDL